MSTQQQCRLNLCVQGVWVPQVEVLFDICLIDTETQSFCDHIPMTVLSSAVCDKSMHRLVKTIELLLPPSMCQLMVCWDVKLWPF